MNKNYKSKFINGRDIFILTIMAFISFIIESTIGLFLLPFVPIPLVGGLASSVIDAIIIFTAIYSVPRRGAAVYFAILLLSMSIITPSFGPPGIYKIFIGLALGLICEIILLLKKSDIIYILAVGVAFGASIPVTYFAWKYANVSAINALKPYLFVFTIVYAILGAIGALIGLRLFKKDYQNIGS